MSNLQNPGYHFGYIHLDNFRVTKFVGDDVPQFTPIQLTQLIAREICLSEIDVEFFFGDTRVSGAKVVQANCNPTRSYLRLDTSGISEVAFTFLRDFIEDKIPERTKAARYLTVSHLLCADWDLAVIAQNVKNDDSIFGDYVINRLDIRLS